MIKAGQIVQHGQVVMGISKLGFKVVNCWLETGHKWKHSWIVRNVLISFVVDLICLSRNIFK